MIGKYAVLDLLDDNQLFLVKIVNVEIIPATWWIPWSARREKVTYVIVGDPSNNEHIAYNFKWDIFIRNANRLDIQFYFKYGNQTYRK